MGRYLVGYSVKERFSSKFMETLLQDLLCMQRKI